LAAPAYQTPQVRVARRHLLLILGLSSAGCGHPATVTECDQIVERIARLELHARADLRDKGALEQQVNLLKKDLKQSTMRDCVGKRITHRAMACVNRAQTSAQIVEDCFD
jgi:hypothetical protein